MQFPEPNRQQPVRAPEPSAPTGMQEDEAGQVALAISYILGDQTNQNIDAIQRDLVANGESSALGAVTRGIVPRDAVTTTARDLAAAGVASSPEDALARAAGVVDKARSNPVEGLIGPSEDDRPLSWDEQVQYVARLENTTATAAEELLAKVGIASVSGEYAAKWVEQDPINVPIPSVGPIPSPGTATGAALLVGALPVAETLIIANIVESLTGKPIGKDVPAGEGLKRIEAWINEAPINQRASRAKQFAEAVDNSGVGTKDGAKLTGTYKRWIYESIVKPDGTVKVTWLDRTAGNVATAADLLPLAGALLRRTARFAGGLVAKGYTKSAKVQTAALLATLRNTKTGTKWGFDIKDLLVGQLPKARVSGNIAALPDDVVTDAMRVTNIRGDISEAIRQIRASNVDQAQIRNGIERGIKYITETLKGRARPAMSTVHVDPTGSRVEFEVAIGRNNTDGFVRAADAVTYKQRLNELGIEAEVRQVNKGILGPVDPAKPVGDYYVVAKHTTEVRPEDAVNFGGSPVTAPTWQGRAASWLSTPSKLLDPRVYGKFASNFYSALTVRERLERIIKPIARLSYTDRKAVGDMLQWASDFGESKRVAPTLADLKAQFPNATKTQITNFYTGRQFFDTLYEINNQQLYSDWLGRGYKTIQGTFGDYHVLPQARSAIDEKGTFLDPQTNLPVTMTARDLDALYATGGGVAKLDRAATSLVGTEHLRVIHRGTNIGMGLSPLSRYVLEYIPGYVPRSYEAPYMIVRTSKGVVDGRAGDEYTSALMTAETIDEAQKKLATLTNNLSAQEARTTKFSIESRRNMTGKDRASRDLDEMRIEGRLFFGERGSRVGAASGGLADIVDPVSMMDRAAKSVSQMVAMEDLTKHQLSMWAATYGPLMKRLGIPNPEYTPYSAVKKALADEMAKVHPGNINKQLFDAYHWYTYIKVMEGNTPAFTLFRKQAVAAAEKLYKVMPRLMKEANRSADRLDLAIATRSLAYFSYIVMRPLRQLALQASQMSFIAPIVVRSGVGPAKWLSETWAVLSILKRRAGEQAGLYSGADKMLKRWAKRTGLSEQELNDLVKNLDQSGLMGTVNVHAISGDILHGGSGVATTPAGQALHILTTPIRVPVKIAAKGFDLGEQWNLTASYLAAYYTHKARINKGVFGPSDWNAVGALASDYSLAMLRPNNASYHYGLAGVATQFLSFTHKASLVGMGAFTGKLPKGFTRADAAKVLAGQMLLYGGAGFGVAPFVYQALDSNPETAGMPQDMKDLVAEGVVDYAVTKALELAVDDEVDLPIGETFAPGGGIVNMMVRYMEAAKSAPLSELLTGPAYSVGGSVATAVQMVSAMRGDGARLALTDAQRYGIMLDALLSGVATGYSDYTKARAAAKVGQWVAANGTKTGVDAKYHEVLARGLFGMAPESLLDMYAMYDKDKEAELEKTAKAQADIVYNLVNKWLAGEMDIDQYNLELAGALAILTAHDDNPLEAQFIEEKFWGMLDTYSRRDGKSIDQQIVDRLTDGLPPSEKQKAIINNSSLLSPEQKEAAVKIMSDMTDEAEKLVKSREESIRNELEERTK